MESQQTTQSSCSATDSPAVPLLSILNVVVDHVMMDPCPFEPDEFGFRQTDDDVFDSGNLGAKSVEDGQAGEAVDLFPSPDGPSFSDAFPAATNQSMGDRESGGNVKTKSTNKSSVRVPVLRIFGPVLRNGDDSAYHKCTQEESKTISLNSVLSADSSSTVTTSYSQQPQSGCLYIHGAYPYMLARPVIAGPDGSMHHGHYYESSQGSSSQDDIFSPKLSSDGSTRRTCIDWDSVDSVSHVLEDVHQRLEGSLRASLESSPNSHKPQPYTASSPQYIRSVTVVTGRGFYTYCPGPPAPFLRVEYYDPSMRWRVKMLLERGLDLSSAYHPDPRVYDYEFEDDDLELGGNNADDVRPLKFRCYEAHIPYTMQVFKDYNLAGLKYVNVGDVRFRQSLPRTLRKRTKEDFLRKKNRNDADNGLYFLRDNVDTELLWPKCENGSNLSDTQQQSTFQHQHWLKKHTSCDLEFDTTVENILNIRDVMTELPSPLEERQKIHWRAVPSLKEIWEQERKRMKLLLTPDKDFLSMTEKEDEETSSCSDDSSDDERHNFELRDDSIPQFTLNVKKNASVPGSRLAVKGVKKLFSTSDGLEDDFRRALKDIVLRHDQFLDDVDKRIAAGLSQHSSASLDDGIEALAALGNQFTQLTQNSTDGDEDVEFNSQSSGSNAKRSTQSNYTMTQLTQAEIDEECEVLEPLIEVDHDDNEDGHSEDGFLCEEEELGEEGLEKTLTYLASQVVASEESNNELVEYEEEAQSEAPIRYSQLFNHRADHSDDEASHHHPSIADDSNLMIDDEHHAVNVIGGDSFDDIIGHGEIEHTEEHVDVNDASQSRVSEELVFQSNESLCRKDVESQAWHPLPTEELNECPSWFGFQWNGSDAEPLIKGSFLEPVKRAPSYNHVQSWLKANKAFSPTTDMTSEHVDSSDCTQIELTQYSQLDQTQEEKSDPLSGLGQQGCKVQVSGGGGLKTTIHTPSAFTPMTLMSIEVHVQCRIKTGVKGYKEMAMVIPDVEVHVLLKTSFLTIYVLVCRCLTLLAMLCTRWSMFLQEIREVARILKSLRKAR
jgi:hypothetical protein